MSQKNLTSYNLISGMRARNYRKKLASLSVSPSDSMLTLKFRLEHSDDLHKKIPFARFQELYDVVEGVGKGTLIHFLFSVILSGFRIFDNAEKARIFFARKNIKDDDFCGAFVGATNMELPNFIPSRIKECLAQDVRSTGGKDNRFCKKVIISEYRNRLASKLPKNIDEGKVEELFSLIAEELLKNPKLKNWNSVKKEKEASLKAVDNAIKRFCGEHEIPKIADMFSNDASLPNNSTIVFDENSVHINSDNEYTPYFVVATILRFDNTIASKDKLIKHVQDNLTTNNNSGLSWLFNNGLNLLKTESLDNLCKSYAVPHSRRESMRQLQDAAKALPEQSLLFNNNNALLSFADFRSVIGGHLDSWVANYINRLEELKDILSGMPDNLRIPDALVSDGVDFLDTTNCNRADIDLLCSRFNGNTIKRTLSALDNLLGKSDTVSAEDILQIEICTEQINQLNAFREQIKNALEQAAQEETSPWKSIKDITKNDWKDWDRIRRLPKLNRMGGGVPDADSELSKSAAHFDYLLDAQKSHFERIRVWVENNGCKLNPLDAIEERHKKRLNSATIKKTMSLKEMAIRYILHRIGNTVRVCNDYFADSVIQWFVSNRIFLNVKDRNKYFFNRLGSLYVSPFSTGGHQPYPVREDIAEVAPELLRSLENMLEDVGVMKNLDAQAQDTFLKLNRLWLGLRLSGLNIPLPEEVAKLDLPKDLEASVPAGLRFKADDKLVPASLARRLFNLYASLLSGMQIVLRRSRFYLRSKFGWIKNNVLYYVPKDKSWKMPERYRDSDAWSPIFDSDVLVFNDNGTVNTLKTFDKVAALPANKLRELKTLLVQLPHDWCYSLPFQVKSDKERKAFRIKKNDDKKKKIDVVKNFARLIGPSSMKSRLDELIVNPTQITVSDMTLLVDQPVNQRKVGGKVILDYEPYEITLAVPIARKKSDVGKDKLPPFTRIVAID